MSVEKRQGKTGPRWVVRVDLGRDPQSGKRRPRSESYKTAREAHRREAEWKAELAHGTRYDARTTLGEYLEHWLTTHARHQVRPSTYGHYRRWARLHLLPTLGRIPLARLSGTDVRALISRMVDGPRLDGAPGGYGARTVRCVYGLLHNVLSDAERLRLVGRNVCRDVSPPRLPHTEQATWSAEQVLTFLEAARLCAYSPLYLLTVCTGLRRGEVLGLRWDDLEGTQITCRASLSRQAGLRLGATKNGKARVLPLPERALRALAEHATAQKRWKLAAGPAWQDTGHIFTTHAGTPLDPEQVVRAFHVIRTRAGLPHIRFHDLRHTHASLALRAGVSMKVISSRLGHATLAFTADTYIHLDAEQQQSAADAMDAILAPLG
jgi:integrase